MFESMADRERPSKCIQFLRLLWKFSRCVFSHVTLISLVVAYCLIGAYAFESLEASHEKEIKRGIKDIRGNVAEQLWKITKEVEVLIRENWTEKALGELKSFENNLIHMMAKEGWDGSEEENNIQWTFAGALFYSIIVITTIGYGHIAPKTKNGKVVTIFYAILGIPLMLLCLSNIGDVMASSFRFLYWKVCCYICTKPPKKPRRPRATFGRSYSVRQSGRYGGGSNKPPLRRSIRISQRSTDSAIGLSETIGRASYSDTECRYHTRRYADGIEPRRAGTYNVKSAGSMAPQYLDEIANSPSKPVRACSSPPSPVRAYSLDRRSHSLTRNETDLSPVLCNKYALDQEDLDERPLEWQRASFLNGTSNREKPCPSCRDSRSENAMARRESERRSRSLPRRCMLLGDEIELDRRPMKEQTASNVRMGESVYLEMDRMRRHSQVGLPRSGRRLRTNYPVARCYRHREQPSIPRTVSASTMHGYPPSVHRQIYTVDGDFDFDYDYYTTSIEEQEKGQQPIKPVPIWLCVFLVVSYIFGGAFLFSEWEKWPFLDSAYFCFITLTTIGFGDFVPAYKLDAHKGIALCSLYLLFGIALLAMSFNLVQEEVINSVKSVAKRLGIVKESDDEEEPDDYECEYGGPETDEEEDHGIRATF